ncbi:hypothetical protein [Thermococcus sp. P6]|uniref:hypothetical protein n=1 Tax=Thermococcus sp. P6 TaxID=122420 RepID=UPI0012FD206B|nr:hypothetical protein [Thermococcus sp. P6]
MIILVLEFFQKLHDNFGIGIFPKTGTHAEGKEGNGRFTPPSDHSGFRGYQRDFWFPKYPLLRRKVLKVYSPTQSRVKRKW